MLPRADNGYVPEAAGDDSLYPPPPQDPYFDAALSAWVLSRFQHVVAAFRDSRLVPAGPRPKPDAPDTSAVARLREETLATLSPTTLERWRGEIEPLAADAAARLPVNRTVDLVHELAFPWCLRVALVVTGADPAHSTRLSELAQEVSAAAAEPYDAEISRRAARANDELDSFVWQSEAIGAATFVALSQTLPSFLANAWLALLRHPAELMRLRGGPALMPRAVEELLRYAGVARVIFRQAAADLEIAGLHFAPGARAALMLASANRDPEQFPDPHRLDLDRRAAGHVALGSGPHSCAGGQLIRMAASVGTRAFVERCGAAQIRGPISWRGGSGFRAPQSVPVLIGG